MKSQKAMSHLTLIIWVIIIVAIGGTIISGFNKSINERNIENLTTDMLLVQGKVKVVAQENEMNSEEHPLIGRKVQENLDEEKIKELIEKNIINEDNENFDKYYIIDSEALEKLNLQSKLDGEYYIVNYKTYEIIYTKGIEIENETKYTLTQLLEHRNSKENNNENKEENNLNQIDEQQEEINSEEE